MIIIYLKGGLGNQLFQYALGRTLEQNGREVKYDVSSYNGYRHNFRLNCFKTKLEIIGESEKPLFNKLYKQNYTRFNGKKGLLFKILRKGFKIIDDYFYIYRSTIHERPFFDKRLENLKGTHVLDGYWAQSAYFEPIRQLLIDELTLKPSTHNPIYSKSIEEIEKAENSVAVHVRRGDYLDSVNQMIFAELQLSYYQKAISYIQERKKTITLFVFSNDISWCRDAFNNYTNATFIESPDLLDVHDFSLMKSCNHNIIANSTFSWWAAYLNDNTDKIVIAPKQWYADRRRQAKYEKSNNNPKEWLKI